MYRQDGGHRVDREDDVGDLDDEQGGQQGCSGPSTVELCEEPLTVELVGDRHDPAHKAETAGGRRLALVGAVADDLGSCVNEEDPEHEQNPPEATNQSGSEQDEYCSQGQGTEDAPEQDPMLVLQWDREDGEQHRPDEHVVHTERLLD